MREIVLGSEAVHGFQLGGFDHVVDAVVAHVLLSGHLLGARLQRIGLDSDESHREDLALVGNVDRVEDPGGHAEALVRLPGPLEVLERLALPEPSPEHSHDHGLPPLVFDRSILTYAYIGI